MDAHATRWPGCLLGLHTVGLPWRPSTGLRTMDACSTSEGHHAESWTHDGWPWNVLRCTAVQKGPWNSLH